MISRPPPRQIQQRAGHRRRKLRRAYARNSVAVWFRVFRAMTRDAMVTLELSRDPTLRVTLPEGSLEPREANALTPDELAAFLAAMRTHYPQHHALVVLLAYTGLRFCHASALRWEDWDEQGGVLRVQRKQVRGQVGPVSRKKRAPKEYPFEPQLAEVLRDHRGRLVAEKANAMREQGVRPIDDAKLVVEGWMFPSSTGTLRTPNSLDRAWTKCLELAKIEKRFHLWSHLSSGQGPLPRRKVGPTVGPTHWKRRRLAELLL